MDIDTPLAQTLRMLAEAVGNATEDWWVIGSAAVALHGGAVGPVNDVDLMMSNRDAKAMISRVRGNRIAPAVSNQFRSQVFGVWNVPPIPVEIFGGFAVADRGDWRLISFSSREARVFAGYRIYVPSAAELVNLLHLFGRTKDLERAKLLRH